MIPDAAIGGVSLADIAAWAAGLGAFAVVLLVWGAFVERDPLEGRLKALQRRRETLKRDLTRPVRRAERQGARLGAMQRIVDRMKLVRGKAAADVAKRLNEAGFRSKEALTIHLFVKTCLPLLAAAAAVAAVYVWKPIELSQTQGLAVCLLAVLAGSMAPDWWVARVAKKRQTAIRRALPDAFDLLVICAEAGLSLDWAFDRVAREMGEGCPDLAEEIGLTAVELGFLPDRAKALQGLAERVPVGGMRALVTTLAQTERYGTPLAQALRVLSNELRNERMLKAEEKAARLPAVMTLPLMVFILPPLFVVLVGPAILRTIDGFSRMLSFRVERGARFGPLDLQAAIR